jgi:Fe-S oxidoreductase/nitrate reductase gamma subunit
MTHAGGADPTGTLAPATRELMWNMGSVSHVLMYVLMVCAFILFGLGLRNRIRAWRSGKPAGEPLSDWGRRLWILLREALFQRATRERWLPGLFHSLVFYSFIVLFVTTLIVMADMDFGLHIYHGPFYLGVSLAADIAGVLLVLGLLIAAARRYLFRPTFLPGNKPADAVILSILAGLVVTGFLAEGARIRFHPAGLDPWRAYSPVGALVAGCLAGIPPETGRAIHFATWWVHALGTFTMIALVPHTKFFHMLSIPTNQLLVKLAPKGSLSRVDIEALLSDENASEDLTLGLASGDQLTWKQKVDLDACIECGRCDDLCPARAVAQPLSPRRLITDLRDLMLRVRGGADSGEPAIRGAKETVFADEQFIWHCRTCHACQSHCPAAVAHVDLFMELRRAEVMMEGRLPGDAGRALKVMEAEGNPFGGQAERLDFVQKLGIPIVGPGGEVEILYWTGCATTFDPEKHAIAADLVAILKHAGVRFGHLGKDERCCGDPARVLGDENLFQASAKETIAALGARRFDILLVSCPHGYNVFKNEYPQLGGHYRVMHHTELLAQWLVEGRLRPQTPLPETVVFHDPCYLGRYQGIIDPPRRALRALPGLRLREMCAHGANSFCCGAGGGHFWMDIDQGEGRPYINRVDQAAAAGASTIAVACAFCFQMLVDGLKRRDLDERMSVVDVATLVRRSLGI